MELGDEVLLYLDEFPAFFREFDTQSKDRISPQGSLQERVRLSHQIEHQRRQLLNMLFDQIMWHVCDKGSHELEAGGPDTALLPTLEEGPQVAFNHSFLRREFGLHYGFLHYGVNNAFIGLFRLLGCSSLLFSILPLALRLSTFRFLGLFNDLVLGLQVQNLGQLPLEMTLVIFIRPPLYEFEAASQRHQHDRSHSLRAVLLLIILNYFELFVGKM